VVNGAATARDGALVTAGAQYRLMNGWSFLAKFDGELSSTTSITAAPAWRRKRGKRLVARSPESKRGVMLNVTFGQHRRKIDHPAR
jgi:hypothetical protein